MPEIRDLVLTAVVVILWAFTCHYAYKTGVEDGYWEHEGEENIYNCQVVT